MRGAALSAGFLAALIGLAACTNDSQPVAPVPSATASPASEATSAAATSASPRAEGATLRFTKGDYSLDVTVGAETPAVCEFLGRLPMQLPFEEFAGREKVGYLPEKLDTSDTPGSDPEDGHLIYFVPWGNLGFYYNAEGIGYSDDIIHIGTYDATAEELKQLENGPVTITLIE